VTRAATYGDLASITGNDRMYAENPGGSAARRSLLGYPVYYSNYATAIGAAAKSVYFGNWYYMGYRMAPELRMITDPYSEDGLVVLKYSFRADYGQLQAAAIGYGVHP
jgi:HK97 family phage major capsid protein